MPVRLLFTLICDDVRIEKSNKLVLIGLYNRTIDFAPQPPDSKDQKGASLKFAVPQLCLVRRWIVDSPGYTARTELIDPEGKVSAALERQLEAPEDGSFYQEIIRLAGPILCPGVYKIVTKCQNGDAADAEVNEERFEVRVVGPSSFESSHIISQSF